MLAIDLTNPEQQAEFYDLFLMALCIWREARGEIVPAKDGVAWVIKNRMSNPSWYGGPSAVSVILKPYQFSSFNSNDPNAVKWPQPNDTAWQACLDVAGEVYYGVGVDPTQGATSYYSTDIPAPTWATEMTFTVAIGSFRFYKR